MQFAFRWKIQLFDDIMTSNDVNLSIKLWLDVGNIEYIILCYFGVRIMRGLEVIEGGRGAFRLARSRPHESFKANGASFLGREASDEVERLICLAWTVFYLSFAPKKGSGVTRLRSLWLYLGVPDFIDSTPSKRQSNLCMFLRYRKGKFVNSVIKLSQTKRFQE